MAVAACGNLSPSPPCAWLTRLRPPHIPGGDLGLRSGTSSSLDRVLCVTPTSASQVPEFGSSPGGCHPFSSGVVPHICGH